MATKRCIKDDPKHSSRSSSSSKKKARISDSSDSADDEKNKEPLVIKCKTVFKKRIVERALQREDERDSDDDQSDRLTLKYFVKYSVEKDVLSVGDVEVIIDETEKILRCSKCSFVNKSQWDKDKKTTNRVLQTMEWSMKNHIIGTHLGGFPCLECKPATMILRSLSSLQKHQLEVHNPQYKKLKLKLKNGDKEGDGEAEEEEPGEENSSSSDGEGVWPNGEKKLKRPYKCSYPNCGKKFHKGVRWRRHEKMVHGGVMEKS